MLNYLIAGGSSGIGLAIARRLVSSGARVVIVGRNQEKLDSAKQILGNDCVLTLALDVSASNSDVELSVFLKANSVELAGIVNCVGVHSVRPFAISKIDNFVDQFSFHVLSSVQVVKAGVKSMRASGGSVVFMSSVAAIRGGGGVSAYSSAKSALGGLMRGLAMEYSGKRIRFNSVLPGVVETEMTQGFFGSLKPEQRDQIVKSHPLGLGQPDDVAGVVEFLLSDNARWITGVEIVVDGGLSCHS